MNKKFEGLSEATKKKIEETAGINIDEKIQQLKDASDRANELANKARDVASAAEKEMQKANPCN